MPVNPKKDNRAFLNELFIPVPDTDLNAFLREVEHLASIAPEILSCIEKDQDAHAKEKKRLRLEDQKFIQAQTDELPGMCAEATELPSDGIGLETGRPRMPPLLVFLCLMLKGFLGSLTDKQSRRLLSESMSLHGFLHDRGMEMPGFTTMAENVNLVSGKTFKLIHDRQIELVLGEGLDDFRQITIDSTAVKANSAWPTDAKMINGHLSRAYRTGRKLEHFGLKNFNQGWMPLWLDKMHAIEFEICLVAGKRGATRKIRKCYAKLFKKACKAIAALEKELGKTESGLNLQAHLPSRRVQLERVVERIRDDITKASRIVDYAEDRIMNGASLPSTEKILSLSDESAAFIQKGGRLPVIGYKPQLVRSAQGFVTALHVPKGNAADSAMLLPSIKESIDRTGVVAELVSTDDGYASAKGRENLLDLGVKHISISGAKGRRLTPEADWRGETYKQARRMRSAVESLMFTLKDGFAFGEVACCGIDAVRAELTGKILAYNLCRIIELRKRKAARQAA
jgi:IS5 family transposase